MILGLEIGLLIAGLIALITGKFKLSKNRVATGAAARIAGLVLMLPLPLALLIGTIITGEKLIQGKPFNPKELQVTVALVELGTVLICAFVGFSIALVASSRPEGGEARPSKDRKATTGEQMLRVPVRSAEEEPRLWVEPVEESPARITSKPSEVRKPSGGAQPRVERRATVRPKRARSSNPAVMWWVVGGVALGFFFCMAAVGGLGLWWWFSSQSAQPSAAGPAVERERAFEADNPQWVPNKEWREQMPKLPQADLPPGGLPQPEQLPGGAVNPLAPPPEPPFKPIVIAQPAAPHLNIRPPKLLEERVVRMLPSTLSDVAVGGGGRFLILYLSRERKLALFDVNAARVVKYLSFTDDIQFAAGMDKLLVALPNQNILQRWSLTTFERELSVPLAGEGRVQSLTMGSASNGPLLIRQGNEGPGAMPSLKFYDIRTMKPLEVKWGQNPGGPLDARYIRASANGKVFGLLGWGPVTLVWDDGRVTITHLLQGGGMYVLPSPDGKFVFTDSAIYTDLLKPAPGGANVRGAMPATHGRFYMAGQSVYLLGDSRPLLTVPAEKPEPGANDPRQILQMMNGNEQLALDKRGYFIPDAKLLIHIPLSNDQLVLRRLDVEAGLEKSGIDYLFVVSQAPFKAKKGTTYRYQLAVKSKKGGVRYRLESGPAGMKVSPTGLVTWDVPRSIAESALDVILTISDRSGQEVFHSFRILPGDQGEEQAPLAVNVPAEPAKPDDKKPEPAQVEERVKPQPKPPEPIVEKPLLPPIRPLPNIPAPRLATDRVVKTLSSAIADVAVGGGGRYLILHLPRERKLAVFDVSQAKMAGYVPLASDNVRFTAGRDKLLVALGDENVLQRWSLATLQREATVPVPTKDRIYGILMGSASEGPLLLATASRRPTDTGMLFVDIKTLETIPLRLDKTSTVSFDEQDSIRVSANGRVFARWRTNTVPQGFWSFVLQDREVHGYHAGLTLGHLAPDPEGKVIYTAGGRYTSQTKSLSDQQNSPLYCLPSTEPTFFLSVEGDFLTFRSQKPQGSLAVHLAGDERPLIRLPEIEVPCKIDITIHERLSVDKRIHFIPSAKLIVTIPDSNDRLVLHRFDIEQALAKSPSDFLFVASHPPAKAKKGATYRYQLAVKSKKGGVKYRLESGPEGMKISNAGLLTWNVPRSQPESEVDVILVLGDKSGQEIFHTFRILPGEEDEDQAPVVADVPAQPEPAQKQVDEAVKPQDKQPKTPAVKRLLPPIRPMPMVAPPRLETDKVVKTLPSAISDVGVGGGGRYLILHLAQERKLAVFDVSQAKITGYVPLPHGNSKFTAGRDQLIVASGDAKVVERWNLATLKREATAPLELFGHDLAAVVMGSASDGPVLVAVSSTRGVVAGTSYFLDVATLKPSLLRHSGADHWHIRSDPKELPPQIQKLLEEGKLNRKDLGLVERKGLPVECTGESFVKILAGAEVRASANGRVFAISGDGKTFPHGLFTFVLGGDGVRVCRDPDITAGRGLVLPAPDGKVMYTSSRLLTPQLQPLGDPLKKPRVQLPAVQPGYLVSIEGGYRWGRQSISRGPLTVHLAGDDRPLARVPEVELPVSLDLWAKEGFSIDKRIHFIPSANLIITLPPPNDRLVLHRFNLEQALEKTDIDYLFIASQAPIQAKKGATYRYPLIVQSKKGEVKYRLETAPEGMKISDTGLLTWEVPHSLDENEVEVRVAVRDKSGKKVIHTFHIFPGNQGEEQTAPAAADLPPQPAKPDVKRAEPEVVKPVIPPRKEEAVRELRSMRISKNSYVHALVFTPDGRDLLSAGDDGRMRRWRVDTGKELSSSFDAHPRVTMLSVGVSADGKLLATSALDKTAKLWDAATNKLLTTCTCSERIPFVHAALSPDGKVLATGTNQVTLWEAATGRSLGTLTARLVFIDVLVFSPDGKQLACSGSGNTVKLWNVAKRKESATLTGHTRPIMSLAFSSDGKTLASASADRTIKLWDLATNKERLTLRGHADPLSSVAFSPDGKLLISGAGAIRFDPGHRGEVKLWDATTGQALTDLRGHTDGVSSVAFSPDGKTIASTARDHTVRLWDVTAYSSQVNTPGAETPRSGGSLR